MKQKLGFLLILLGAVIGGFNMTDMLIPELVIAIIGGFLLGFSLLMFTGIYSGRVWGIKIKDPSAFVKVLLSAIGLVIGGISLVITPVYCFTLLLEGEFITLLINAVAFIIALIIGPLVAKIVMEKLVAKGNKASVLGQLDIFKEIDTNMEQATSFVVGFEGVALYSSTNYCYAVYLYEDYQLGQLSTPDEVALVGTYFVEKYHDNFTFKIDTEVIPGQPGATAVAVGSGVIAVARVHGTPDQRLFRSYIFTKKK
jgi:hypothetical protein